MVPFLCFALWLGADSARGQSLIEDSRIKTWTYPLSGWNMESGASFYADIQLPSAIKATKILGLQVLVLSDEAFPEVFNLTRLSGKLGSTNIGRSGGRSNFFIYDDGKLFVTFERGECQVDLTGTCQTGTNPKTGGPWQTGFFANGKHDGAPEQTYPNRIQRSFYNAGKTRLVLKIQYDCASNCGGTATNKFWKQIGTWDMKTQGAKTYPENTFGIHPSRLVDLNAAIHSDPNSGNKIQVDNLEHLGTRIGSYPINRGRGGILWYGYGLWRGGGVPSNQYALRLHQGPNTEGTSSANVVTSYRSTYYMPDPNSQVGLKYTDGAASGRNRGWIMLEYTGAKSAVKIPYLFLSRAYPIPPWNMMESDARTASRESPRPSFPTIRIAFRNASPAIRSIISIVRMSGAGGREPDPLSRARTWAD
jgi:hypothetical protein